MSVYGSDDCISISGVDDKRTEKNKHTILIFCKSVSSFRVEWREREREEQKQQEFPFQYVFQLAHKTFKQLQKKETCIWCGVKAAIGTHTYLNVGLKR